MRLMSLIVGLVGALALSSQAHALDFYFWFDSDPVLAADPSTGYIPGTVSGIIYGLQDNAYSAARSVVVTGYPTGVTGLPALDFTIDDYAALHGRAVTKNQFLVIDGQIVDALYQITGGYFDINVNGEFNALASPDAATRVQNQFGLSGVRFVAVPEPATWGIMLVGFGLTGLTLRRRRAALAAI